MKKKFTFMILAMLFAILGSSAEAWGQTRENQTLTFNLSSNPGGWPTTNSTTLTEYTYTLNDVDYTFALKNVKCNSGYLMLTYTAVLGLPAIENYKLTKVVASNSGGCSTSTKVGISSSSSSAYYISGGAIQTWSTTSSSYTYNLSETEANTMYYMYVTNKNAQVVQLTLTYESTGTPSTDPSITVNPTTITWNDSPINEELSETISVSQANLTEGITISSTIGTVTPSTIEAGEDATDVTFTYTPTSVGDFEVEITFTSGETTATVSVTGSAYDPSQVDTYELFTGDLVEGDYVIYYGGKAMKNTVTSSRLDYSEVSPVNNAIANPDAAIVWHIAQSGDYWTIFNAAVEKYAAGNGTKNQATLLTDGTDNGSLWTVSGTETHDFTNKKNTSSNVNATLRNNGTYGFACYATSTGGALTLYKKAENKAATPTLTESQIFAMKPFNVTITNNEAGATVYYTTDGNDPTTETTTNFMGESTTIQINTTTTVKAMAVVEGKANSEIASATYTEQKNDPENQWTAETYTATIGGENTFPTFFTQSDGAVTYTSSNTNAATIDATGNITLVAAGTTTITASTAETDTYMAGEASYTLTVKEAPLATMDAIFAKATAVGTTATNVEVTFDNWVISGVKSSNAYLTDNAGKGLIIYTSDHGFAVGDVLNGTIACQIKLYSGASELMGVTSETSGLTVTKNGEITIHEVSIADLIGVNTGAVIKVNNVQYNGTNLVDENSNIIKPYNAVDYNPTFTNGLKYNVTGVYIQFNTTKEIAPRNANDIVLIVEAPTFNPEGGNYNAAQTVEITSATTGATIYYTLDNSNPTTGSTPYTDPIEISKSTTIKAIAVKNGVSSEIATAVYTITITTVATPTFEPEDGSYFNESLEVSLDCATDGATIVYTTDDWATSTNYTDKFTITETTTVKAKATKTGMDESEIAEATFTKKYKVNYVVNGNGSLFEPTYVTPSSAIGTLPTPGDEYIPTGFDFAGWSDSKSSTTTIGETYIVDADVILYAVFSREVPSPSTEEAVTIIDGSKLTSTATTTDTYQTFDEHVITFSKGAKKQAVQSGAENYFTKDEAILIGKKDTYIYNTTPFDKITKFEVYANKGASTKVSVGINFSTSAISSYSETADNTWTETLSTLDNVYDASAKLPTGAKYFWYQVTNDNNSQVQFRITYQKPTTTTEYYIRVFEESEIDDLTVEAPMIIMGGYTLTVTNDLEIANNAAFTIEENATVVVNGKLTNTKAENLVIEDGGQLIVNNSGVQATMKKNIGSTPSKESNVKWYTISSPLAANTEFKNVTNLIPNSVTDTDYDLYYLDEENGVWVNSRLEGGANPDFKTIDKGVGYIYHNDADTELAFKGEINVNNVTDVSLTLTADKGKGYNLIGNPFTQNIKLANVTGVDLANGFYVLTNQNTWGAKIETRSIAPLQGFLVQVDGETGGTATIEKPAAPSKGERSNEQSTNIEIIVSNSSYTDNAYAMFGEGTGLNKVSHRNTQAPMLYVPQDGEDFAIAFMDESTTIFPVSFKAMTTGNYSISLKATDDISTLVLVDNMTGEETNMLLEESYKFIGSPADNDNRFTVKLSISHNDGQSDSEHFVYQNGSELVVNGEGTLQIFDVLGRVVISEEVHGQTVNVGGLNTGAYIVRLTGESVKTQKIVVR